MTTPSKAVDHSNWLPRLSLKIRQEPTARLPGRQWRQLPTHNASCYPDATRQIMQWMWRGGGHRSQSRPRRVFLCSICSRVSGYHLVTEGSDGAGTGGGGCSIWGPGRKKFNTLCIYNLFFEKNDAKDLTPFLSPVLYSCTRR